MAVGERAIQMDGGLVRLDGLRTAAHVLEQHAEVIEEERFVSMALDSFPVGSFGLDQESRLVELAASVNVFIDVRLARDYDRPLQHAQRSVRRTAFEGQQ